MTNSDPTPVLRADALDDALDDIEPPEEEAGEAEEEVKALPGEPAGGIPVAYEIPGGGWGIRYE